MNLKRILVLGLCFSSVAMAASTKSKPNVLCSQALIAKSLVTPSKPIGTNLAQMIATDMVLEASLAGISLQELKQRLSDYAKAAPWFLSKSTKSRSSKFSLKDFIHEKINSDDQALRIQNLEKITRSLEIVYVILVSDSFFWKHSYLETTPMRSKKFQNHTDPAFILSLIESNLYRVGLNGKYDFESQVSRQSYFLQNSLTYALEKLKAMSEKERSKLLPEIQKKRMEVALLWDEGKNHDAIRKLHDLFDLLEISPAVPNTSAELAPSVQKMLRYRDPSLTVEIVLELDENALFTAEDRKQVKAQDDRIARETLMEKIARTNAGETFELFDSVSIDRGEKRTFLWSMTDWSKNRVALHTSVEVLKKLANAKGVKRIFPE